MALPQSTVLNASRTPTKAPAPPKLTTGAQPLSAITQTTAGTAQPPAPLPQAPGVSLSPTVANSDLRGQTITPGPMADRYKIAQDQFDTFAKASQPHYTRAVDTAVSRAAGAGQLGSGQLRTSLGDAQNNRELQLDTARDTFLSNALQGSIDDAYRNLGIAQQQQQFQAGLQNQTFGQNLALTGMQDQLTNSAFNRGATQYQLGKSGNPNDLKLALSQQYGNQAAAGGSALSNLIGSSSSNNAAQQQQSELQRILQSLGLGGSVNPQFPTNTPQPFMTDDPMGGVYG